MKTNTNNSILSKVVKRESIQTHDLIATFQISTVTVRKQRKSSVKSGMLRKFRKPHTLRDIVNPAIVLYTRLFSQKEIDKWKKIDTL